MTDKELEFANKKILEARIEGNLFIYENETDKKFLKIIKLEKQEIKFRKLGAEIITLCKIAEKEIYFTTLDGGYSSSYQIDFFDNLEDALIFFNYPKWEI